MAYEYPGNPTGFVNDYAEVLTEEQRSQIENLLSKNEKDTGNEISIVTIRSLDGDTVENFAEKLFQDWGIGKDEKDNGVLVLYAMNDRQVRIEVGYGLEPLLSDIYASRIIRETIVPNFQSGKYFEGIEASTKQIVQLTGGEIPVELAQGEAPANVSDKIAPIFVFLVFFGINFIMAAASILAKSKSWWAGGVMGFVIAIILSLIFTFWIGLIAALVLTPLGLLFDFLVSRSYKKSLLTGSKPWWMRSGGGRGFGGGGGFGGFGGGSSGGGGASGRW